MPRRFSALAMRCNFDATVTNKQFQVFSSQTASTYGAEPQLDVNWYQNDVGPFDTRIYGQAVHFVNTNSNMPEATRVHLEPVINLPWSNDWASLNTEAKLMRHTISRKILMITIPATTPILRKA